MTVSIRVDRPLCSAHPDIPGSTSPRHWISCSGLFQSKIQMPDPETDEP